MNNQRMGNYVWREYWVRKRGSINEQRFVRTDDTEMLEKWLRPGTEITLSVSAATFANPQWEPTYLAPLYFKVCCKNFTAARNSAREVLSYMRKNWKIPSSCVEIICDSYFKLMLVIQPVVFGGWPNRLMAEINYHLAHILADENIFGRDEGIVGIDLEAYDRHHYLPVPNSRRVLGDQGYIVALAAKELSMSSTRILKLAKDQRRKANPVKPRRIPQAVEWFAQFYKLIEERRKFQEEKFRIMMEKRGGWEVPPCIQKLEENMPKDDRQMEAGRIIAQFLAWIKASPAEIRWRLMCLGVHSPIQILGEEPIVTYAIENPGFDGCQDMLLREWCPEEYSCFVDIWKELRDKGKSGDA